MTPVQKPANRPRLPQDSFTCGEEGVILSAAETLVFRGLFADNQSKPYQKVSG